MKRTKRTQRAPRVNRDWQHALRFGCELQRCADDLLKDPEASGTSRAIANLFRDGALNIRKAVVLYVGLTRLQSRSESQRKTIMAAYLEELSREDFGSPGHEKIRRYLEDVFPDRDGEGGIGVNEIRKRAKRFRPKLRPGTPTRMFLDAIYSSVANDFYQEPFASPPAKKSTVGHPGRKFKVS